MNAYSYLEDASAEVDKGHAEEVAKLKAELAALRSGGEACNMLDLADQVAQKILNESLRLGPAKEDMKRFAWVGTSFITKKAHDALRTAYAMGKAAGREPLEATYEKQGDWYRVYVNGHHIQGFEKDQNEARMLCVMLNGAFRAIAGKLLDAALTPASEASGGGIPHYRLKEAFTNASGETNLIYEAIDPETTIPYQLSATHKVRRAPKEGVDYTYPKEGHRETASWWCDACYSEVTDVFKSTEGTCCSKCKHELVKLNRLKPRRIVPEEDEEQPAMTSELIKRADEFIAKHKGKNYRDMGEMAKAVALVEDLKAAIQPAPLREEERENLSTSVVDDYRKTAGTVRVIDLYVIARRAIDATVRAMRGE